MHRLKFGVAAESNLVRHVAAAALSLVFAVLLTLASATTAQADPTSTTLSITPNPSTLGGLVTVEATVTNSFSSISGAPTGSVKFTLPGGSSHTVPLVVGPLFSSVAEWTTTALSGGGATAEYIPDDVSFDSSDETIIMTVGKAISTTSVTATPDPSVKSQEVTLTATVSPPSSLGITPTGTVTFIGGSLFEIVPLDANGQAVLVTTALAIGSNMIQANYIGDGIFESSSGSTNVEVNPGQTTISVTATPSLSTSGQMVEVKAKVEVLAPATGTPLGDVEFTTPDGQPVFGLVDANGEASFQSITLTTGTITATYVGDGTGDFATSTNTTSVTVIASTTTTVTATPDPSVKGDSVTVTATVAATPDTPTGSVTFVGPGGINQTVPLDGAGKATLTTTALETGQITANYGGDTGFASSSGNVNVTVVPGYTATTLTATPAQSVTGQLVTLEATISALPPSVGTPTGTVTFSDGASLNETVQLVGGVATYQSDSLTTGQITATYSGAGSDYSGSSDDVSVTVNPGDTMTSMGILPDPSVTGETVTLVASVSAALPSIGTPTGSVTFTGNGVNQTVALDGAGQAVTQVSTLKTGMVTATYSGDGLFNGSFDTSSAVVNAGSTTTTVVATPSSSNKGDSVTVTATVAPAAPATGVPEGSVTFTNGSGLYETVQLVGGVASFQSTTLTTSEITASYTSINTDFTDSSDTTNVTVTTGTTTTVSASPNPSVAGQVVTITATIAVVPPGTGVPDGTVTFSGPGGLDVTATVISGQAVIMTTTLETGTITANYNGKDDFAPSSDSTGVIVDPASTTVTVTATPNPSVTGQSVTVTATVAPVAPGTGVPDGTVTFSGPGGLDVTATVINGQAAITTTTLTTGTVTADYNGSNNYSASSGSANVTIFPGNTTTTVTITPDPSVTGQDVTVTATVSPIAPSTGVPEGTVAFEDIGGPIGTATVINGQASFSTNTLTTGPIIATFNSSNGVFTASIGSADVTVGSGNTTTSVTATPNPSTPGEIVTVEATVEAVAPATGTPSGSVMFSGPGGLSETVTLDGNGKATLTTTTLETGQITASYGGDDYFEASSGTTDMTIQGLETTTTVSATPDPSTTGESVTVTATVAVVAQGSDTPTGTVTFTGPGGLNETVPLNLAGHAALTTSTLASGTITATYSGDANFEGSSGTTTVTVNAVGFSFDPLAGALPAAEEGVGYKQAITTSGGTAPYTYVVTAGSLPEGLSLNASTGTISGTPITSGAYGFTLSVTDANHQTGTVTYTLAVAMNRPNPATDPEVTGLLKAQADTVRRLAQVQVRNFQGRLEGLHNEGSRRASSASLRVGFAQRNPASEAERQINQMLAGDQQAAETDGYTAPRGATLNLLGYGTDGLLSSMSSNGSHSASHVIAPDFGRFAIWSGGFVNFGENDNGGLALDYTMAGVSGGFDYRFSDQFIAGFGAGYGRDRTDIGDNGTENRANAYSGAIYGSYQPITNLFIDGLAGASWLDFDSKRFVSSTGDFVLGNRSGTQLFGTLTAAYEFRDDIWLISPYGRLEFSRSWLDAYSETGDLGLTYGKQTIDSLSGVLGLRANYSYQTDWGFLTPGVRAEYSHDFEGSARASLGYADFGNLPYAVDVDSKVRDSVTLGLSLDMNTESDWNFGLDYRTSLGGGSGNQDHTLGAKLRVNF